MVSGIASGTAVWSTRIMLLARVMAANVDQRARDEDPTAWPVIPAATPSHGRTSSSLLAYSYACSIMGYKDGASHKAALGSALVRRRPTHRRALEVPSFSVDLIPLRAPPRSL